MKKLAALTILAITFLTCLQALPASAQTRTWVSASGSDSSSSCSATAPCATFASAYGKTNAGGEITCLGPGPYAGLQIEKSITINCADGSSAIVGSGVGFYPITVAATDQVILRGLDIDSTGSTIASAITFLGAGTLVLDRMKITSSNTTSGGGIFFKPNGTGKLVVTDSIIVNNGGASTGAGILVKPQSGGTAQVVLERVNVSANTFGIVADGTGSTGGINMTIVDSVSSSNSQDGIIAVTPAGGAPIGVLVTNTKSVNNNIGIRSIGTNVTVRVDGSSIIGNGTGLSFSSGGALLTFGNNKVEANAANGAFSGSLALK